ncbi:MAG: hypothetical protein KJZ69_14945 [Phycisphaerales bacterium]|nr:hypothetical protein [Phycisphaerales bacterium]
MANQAGLGGVSRRLRTGFGAAWAAASLVFPGPEPALAQRFNVVEYEYPIEFRFLDVNAINNAGEMVGTGYFRENNNWSESALLWRADGRVSQLPHLLPSAATNFYSGSRSSQAHDINDDGVIAGRSEGRNRPELAVLWLDANTVVDLLGRDSVAYDLNDSLQVSGSFARSGFSVEPFFWESGQWFSLHPPMTQVKGMNNLGQVVGEGGGEALLFDRDRNEFTVLPPLRPGAEARAMAINDLGVISGWSQTDGDLYHPVCWKDGKVRELPRMRPDTDASASVINIHGDMTGASFFPQTRPVYYRNNLVMLIDDLLLEALRDDWAIGTGVKLNDAGQVGGWGYHYPSERVAPARLDPVDTGLTLWNIEPSRPGVRNEIQINHATPGGRVLLLWGTTRGEPQPLEQCPGAMIDIIDPRLAATAVAGPDGRALIRINIPAHIDATYMFQVVDHETCETSPPAWAIIQPEN